MGMKAEINELKKQLRAGVKRARTQAKVNAEISKENHQLKQELMELKGDYDGKRVAVEEKNEDIAGLKQSLRESEENVELWHGRWNKENEEVRTLTHMIQIVRVTIGLDIPS